MRLFIGIPLSRECSEGLFSAAAGLRQLYRDVRWVPAENYHVTVLFLGEVAETHIAKISGLLDTLPDLSPAIARVEEFIQFPPRGNPRVIAAGLGIGSELCAVIHRQVEELFPEYGEKRRYIPHITIGRVRRGLRVSGLVPLPGTADLRFEIKQVVLYESKLGRSGAVYHPLHTIPLPKSARPLK